MNGDRKFDLVSSSTAGNNVKVRLGNGDGTFGSDLTYAAPAAGDVILGDLNGDTYLDIVVAREPAQTPECVSAGSCAGFSVLLNDGDGTFGSANTIPVPHAASVVGVDVDDLDGDGKRDVLLGAPPLTAGDPAIHVFFGDDGGGFPKRNSWAIEGAVRDVVAENLNHSGTPSVITYETLNPDRVAVYDSVWTASPQPSVTTSSRLLVSNTPSAQLTTGDFNNDGWMDIATSYLRWDGSNIALFRMNGSQRILSFNELGESPATYTDHAANDVDEDGDLDLVIAKTGLYAASSWTVHVNQNGAFKTIDEGALTGNTPPTLVRTADLDRDGRTDIVYLVSDTDSIIPLRNECMPRYASAALSSSPNPSSYGSNTTFTATITPKSGAPTPTGTVTFYEGATVLGTATLNDAGNAILTLSTFAVGSHDVHAVYGGDSEFGSATTPILTHTIQRPPFGAPLNVVATGNGAAAAITIRWVSTSDVASHDVLRRQNGAWVVIGNTTDEIFTDTNVVNTSAYIYAVRSHSTSGTLSPNSNADIATTATLALPSDRKIRASDILTTRQLIASLRAAAGATPFTFTDASLTGVVVKAVHLTELRAAVNPPRTALGIPPVAFTNPTPTVRVTTVKQIDIQEIRNSFQ